MLKKEQKEKLEIFCQALDGVAHRGLFDLGLIIKKATLKKEDLVSGYPKTKDAFWFELDKDSYTDDFLALLLKAFKEKKWLFLELKDGYLPGKVYDQLARLSESNRLQIIYPPQSNEELITMPQPKEFRLAVVTTRETLEKKIKSNIIQLFGPAVSLDK